MSNFEHELIICSVNAGYGDIAVDTARKAGARGGTVINARGAANLEAEKEFKITVQPEKEILMIVIQPEIRDAVLHALYQTVGTATDAQGIIFSLPVDRAVGITDTPIPPAIEKNTEK